jgi:enoyl-CoA hydratase/carnithine racemase
MTFETVLYDVHDGVCTVTLNRPEKMNTWTARLAMDLSSALRQANDDDRVRAIVITGAGRAFCAGADLERGAEVFAGRDTNDRAQADLPTVYPNQIDKPVIAAINGPAVGVGMTYPMLCDIRLAAETAKMGFVFTRRGMMPELAAHLIVQRVIGFSNAADVLMSGRIFTAQEAAGMGLVSRALPKEDLLPAATAMARGFANAAPASVALTKRLLWKGLDSSLEQMMQAEHRPFAWLGNQADAREGIMSFLEKRPPAWTGSPRDIPEQFR